MSGRAKDVTSVTNRQLLRYTPHTLWVEGKNPPVIPLRMSMRSVMAAILTLPPNQRNIMLGRLPVKVKMSLISLGWRVTSTPRSNENLKPSTGSRDY